MPRAKGDSREGGVQRADDSHSGARGLHLLLVLAIATLGLHAARYWPFIADDALISLRYSKRLLQGMGLTWDSYDPVEGYSNLLWVLANAGLGSSGIDLVAGSRILGGLGMGIALLACFAAARAFRWPGALPFSSSVFVLALSGSMAVWLIGGLEQSFVAALLAWSIVLVQRAVDEEEPGRALVLGAGALLSLQVLTRPDGPVLVVALAAAMWCARGFTRRELWRCVPLVALPVAAFAAQMLFRVAYYGDWLPNTAYVKLALTWTRAQSGLVYLGQGASYLLPVLLTSTLAFHPRVREHLARRRLLAPLFVLVAWSAYLVSVGGDIFPARRHFIPIVVALALIQGDVAAAMVRAGGWLRRSARPVFGAALLAWGSGQYHDPENRRAISERWEWDGRTIGLFYKQAFGGKQPLLATAAAGCLPFWSELPSVDMLGLSDRKIARSRLPGFGEGPLGHESGDGAYVLSREPDLVIEGLGANRTDLLWSPGARQMVSSPEWSHHYTRVRFLAGEPELVFYTYVRRTSEKIGIRRTPAATDVPGFLFSSGTRSAAGFDPSGALAIALSEATPAGPLRLELDAGRWRLEIETYGDRSGEVTLVVRRPGIGPRALSANEILDVRESDSVLATLATRARDAIYVRRIALRRL